MNYTQNEKIEQVTESTLVLGVDIGSSEHYVKAFDYRGRELTRKVFKFLTDINGFNTFYDWVTQICVKHGKNEAMIAVGCKLIRVLFAIMTKGEVFNTSKMIKDIHRPKELLQVA